VRIVLAAVILVGFIVYAVVAHFVRTPRIFYDELVYMEASESFSAGDGLQVRDQPYDYGPLYPVLLAPLHLIAADREGVYELGKALNAFLFALAAIPIYLLARRLLAAGPSVAVAVLSVVVPSSVYVTVVMTESLAYLTFSWAVLAIVLALERPTVGPQLAALAAIGVSFLARPQFALLYLAFVAALVLAFFLDPERRREGARRHLSRLWPVWASAVLGFALFVLRPLARGDSPREALGDYDVLYRSYDLALLAKWLVWHLSALELYLAVVPVAIAPIVVGIYLARARAGSARHAAFVSAFIAVNAFAIAVVAAVVTYQDSPELEIDRLHDRYLFYVVPLWLIVLVAWIEEGVPRPRRMVMVGAGCTLILGALFPFHDLDLENGVKLFSAVGSALPAAVKELGGSTLVGALAVLALITVLLATVLTRPSRAAVRTAVATLVAVFLLNGLLVYGRAFNPPEADVFAASTTERLWVDRHVPDGASVTLLQSSCEDAPLERDSYILTEFFNSSVREVVRIDGDLRGAGLADDGSVVLRTGRYVEASYVVAQPGLRLHGAELAKGTTVGLVLWNVGGRIRVADLTTTGAAGDGFCFPSPA
jgi:Dolichyl-phosphate-mannose-protein mannosyltransferase